MGQTLQEFSMKWSHWQQECRHRLESETYAANPHLHALCQVKKKNDFKTAVCKFKLLMLILVLPILIMYEIFYIFCYLKFIWLEKLLVLIMFPESASYTDPGNPPLFCPDTLWRGRRI